MDGHEETVYCNLLQPLVGAAPLSFFWSSVGLFGIRAQLNQQKIQKKNELQTYKLHSAVEYVYVSLSTFIGEMKVFTGCFLRRISGKMSIFRCDVCHSSTCAQLRTKEQPTVTHGNNTAPYIG